MNYRPSAPGASGLVCSGARLVITTAQLRESPETVEEEPERAESLGPMEGRLRRAPGDRGGAGCSGDDLQLPGAGSPGA
jgi:hypothetical protein